MSRLAANCILLLTAVIWGFAFVTQATAMSKIGPLLFIGLRSMLGVAAVLPFALREGRGRLLPPVGADARDWQVPAALLAAIFLFENLAQQFGIMGTSVTNAGFITTLYVILVPVFGIALFRQWPHPAVWPAAIVATGGTWLLGGGLDGLRLGDALVLLSAVFCALQVVFLDRLIRITGRPFFSVLVQLLGCAIGGLVLAVLFEPVRLEAIAGAAPELIYAGAVSGGLAFSLQAIGQRYTRAADAAVVLSSESLFAAISAAVFLGERLTLSGWLGCGLILAAVLAVQLAPLLGPGPGAFRENSGAAR